MGNTRKNIFASAFLVLVFIWIFPSWVYVLDGPDFAFRAKIGSSWLWAPPMPYGVALDWGKNLVFSLGVILLSAALCLWASLVKKSY